MSALVASYDWSSTPLGPMAQWPQSLKTMVRFMLDSRYAMWMGWGPELTFFYNDTYARDTLAKKHPSALGRPASEVWSEVWAQVASRVASVLDGGQATWDEGLLLFLERNGYSEETYHSFSYSPVYGDDNAIAGMFCVVTEETKRVLGERRVAALRDVAAALIPAVNEPEVYAATARGVDARTMPFTMSFKAMGDGFALMARSGFTEGSFDAAMLDPASWPLAASRDGRCEVSVDDLATRFTKVPTGPWQRPPASALLVPLQQSGAPHIDAVLVVGVNPHRALDVDYRSFIDLFVGQVTAALTRVRVTTVSTALVQSRRRSDSALLAGDVGTYYWDIPAGRISGDANFMRILGLNADEQGSVPVAAGIAAIHPEDRSKAGTTIQRTIADVSPFEIEYRILHPTGLRWVIARGVVEHDRNGEPLIRAGVVVDITERKQAEQRVLDVERGARLEAERLGRMKDEFLATLSHELRTPLNAMLGWTQILRNRRTPEEIDEGLDVIERNARNQAQLIEELLDMSRIVSGKVRLDVQRVNLAEVIGAAIDVIRPGADAKSLRLLQTIDPQAGPVSGDPGRLQQILWNLLSNAVKFTPKGGRIHLLLARVNSHIELSISDTGQGIGEEFLPHVFERFRQEDGTIGRVHGGLGLGLAIVKQLAELHGGTVQVLSPGTGKGATFIVSLPIAPLHPEAVEAPRAHPVTASREPASAVEVPRLDRLKVLVVDNDRDAREVLRFMLEACGASVVTAESGSEAIAKLRLERPDLLLSDIGMPVMDGYELMRRVRQLPAQEGGRVPAVAITAFARSEDRRRALMAGYQMHVAKPVEPDELRAVCASLARR